MSGSGDSPPGQADAIWQAFLDGQPASASKPDSTNADENDEKAIPALLDWLSGGTSEKQEEQQQPGKPAANAGQGTPALSSAAGTGHIDLAKVGGSASQPAQPPQRAIKRDVFNPLLDACTWDHGTGAWLTPATGPDARLCGMDWQNMLKLPPGWTPTSFVPTFFHDEPDPNQRDKPRLDIVVSFDNGHSVRYHPRAAPIWSTSPQPTDAMQKRYNRAKHVGRRGTGT